MYSGILLSHKKKQNLLFVVRWMDIETVIQSEVSHKEKNIYFMLTYIWNLKKKKKGQKNLGARRK